MILMSQIVQAVQKVPFVGDCYEFGVYNGRSFFEMLAAFARNNIRVHKYYGFDSFAGLPKEKNGLAIPPEWKEGQLNSGTSYAEICEIAKSYDNVQIVKGFFSDVLTSSFFNSQKLQKAMFVNIDCDLYISAFQALDALFSYGVIVPNTVIHYDDWGGTVEYAGGESKAHADIATKHGVAFEEVCEYKNGIHVQKLFVVKSIA